jgi:hypothetical protein
MNIYMTESKKTYIKSSSLRTQGPSWDFLPLEKVCDGDIKRQLGPCLRRDDVCHD